MLPVSIYEVIDCFCRISSLEKLNQNPTSPDAFVHMINDGFREEFVCLLCGFNFDKGCATSW